MGIDAIPEYSTGMGNNLNQLTPNGTHPFVSQMNPTPFNIPGSQLTTQNLAENMTIDPIQSNKSKIVMQVNRYVPHYQRIP